MKVSISALGTFFVGFVAGWVLLISAWGGVQKINVSQFRENSMGRDPAAIRKVFDFSKLKGGALASASKRRLLMGADVIHEEKRVGLQLGHFVVGGPEGKRVFACSRYTEVELTFEAEGFATSGERARMVVSGDCRVSNDINQIEPIWLPVSQILDETPGEMELEYLEGSQVSLRFEHLVDSWPSSWELKRVRLRNPASEFFDTVTVTDEDIRRYTGKPFSLKWFQ